MTYGETIRDVIHRVREHPNWYLSNNGCLRRASGRQENGRRGHIECPITAGTGLPAARSGAVAHERSYDADAATDLINAADGDSLRAPELRQRLMEACGQ